MTEGLLRRALRALAIAIVVAALIDPVLTVERTPAMPLALIDLTSTDILPAVERLRQLNPGMAIDIRRPIAGRMPCARAERCVAVTDGSVHAAAPPDLNPPLSVIRLADATEPNVRLISVHASSSHTAAGAVARVTLEGRGVSGRRTEVRLSDGDASVGRAWVDWSADASHVVDVGWWALGPGPRTLRVEAVTPGQESTVADDAIDIGVNVATARWPLLVFDARPSWASTFVRRALEDDRRFQVDHRARLAPGLTAGTANGRLDLRALDEAAVVIVGGPDALTAADVELIDRFVRVRGGTAILLPERLPAGAVSRLMPGAWSEQLTAEPRAVGLVRASETLHAGNADDAMIARPIGAGRIVISTAMDAWRYRDADAGAFDRFWRSLTAEGAAAGERLRLEFDDGLAVPGSRHSFTVRYRSMTPSASIEASAVARCGPPSPRPADVPPRVAAADHQARAIRLWPAGAPGVLRGELPIGESGACTVEAAVNDARAGGGVAVKAGPSRSVVDTITALERDARAAGGVVTPIDNLAALPRHTPADPVPVPAWPMRSAWWLLPFAGSLSLEWWLRRRIGLR